VVAPPGRARGRGVALAVRGMFQAPTSVRYRLDADGRITVLTGLPEQGSGMHTVLQRVAAAVLGVDLGLIRVVRGATSEALFDPGASASWVTAIAGQAAALGAAEFKSRLLELAAETRGWPTGTVVLEGGHFKETSRGETVGFQELAIEMTRAGNVVLDATYQPPPPSEPGFANFAAYLADVDVDLATGEIDVRDVVLAIDVGAIVNPIGHQGQLDGSLMFGLGTAKMEELVLADGRPTNANLADYKLPTQADMPRFRTVLVPTGAGPGPFGAKAAGEVANSALAPAIANAIHAATGARILDLPLTPERVLAAVHARASTSSQGSHVP
jgi:xanthine dehydrogenase molybdenum-binding subunit